MRGFAIPVFALTIIGISLLNLYFNSTQAKSATPTPLGELEVTECVLVSESNFFDVERCEDKQTGLIFYQNEAGFAFK